MMNGTQPSVEDYLLGSEAAEQLRQARIQAAEERQAALLRRGGEKIGAAFAGTKADTASADEQLKLAGTRVGEVQDQLLKKAGLIGKQQDRQLAQKRFDEQTKQASLANAYTVARLGYQQQGLDANMAHQKAMQDLKKQELALKGTEKKTGKQLPASVGSNVAEFDAAEKSIKMIDEKFGEKASGKLAPIAEWLPGTDASSYDDDRKAAAQDIGRIMEGGKLTEEDFQRYYDMLPDPTDSDERAANKINTLSKMMVDKKQSIVQGLSDAGYNTSKFKMTDPYQSKVFQPSGTAIADEGKKKVLRKQYSASRNQTKIIYNDGTEEVVDGKQ